MDILEEGIFEHQCEYAGCNVNVIFDDEPMCFVHSPDEGSSVRGYSAKDKAAQRAANTST